MLTSALVRGLPTHRNERYCGRRRRDRHAEPHHQDLAGQRLTFPAGITRDEARATTRLYLITPPALDPDRFAKDLEAALAGGDVACLQLRLKDAGDDEIRRATRILQPIAQERGAAFIMNDRPDLAAELECDGVHVGEEDTPYAEALDNLFRSVGLEVELFGSPQEFLQSERPDRPGCIVL